MANYSPQHGNDSPGHWQSSVNHLQTADGAIQYSRTANDSSGPSTNGTTNGSAFPRQDQPGTVITRMTPYGAPWSYSIGAEHIRIPVAPEALGYSTQPAYPSTAESNGNEGQRVAPAGRIWNAIKEEPEDLTGRHRANKSHQQHNDGIQGNVDSQTNEAESVSDSDSDLCIDDLQRGAAGIHKRKKTVPPSMMNSVTPAELQKRPGLIPLTSNLAGPVQVMTAKDGAKLYSCPECNLFYADHLAFEIHLQAHGVSLGKRHVCKECGTSFRRREHLDAHMTAHSQDRPFACETCGRAFKRNEHLTRHRVLHSGDKQHVCADCGKSFFRKDHLMKHSQTHIMRKLASGEG